MSMEEKKSVKHRWEWIDWLGILLAVGIVMVGLFALLEPVMGAALFGAPLTSAGDQRWVRVGGFRDIALGLVLAVPLLLQHRRISGLLILFAAIIPAGDACIVFFASGVNHHTLMHALVVIFMIVLGVSFLRR
jgi:hypothetical protein